MKPDEEKPDLESEETAPDSDTQSSASSAQGNRDTEEHLAPNAPAEGER
ncbi:hypothetical protein [Larkinella rosea]|nr:hypothetical protein [Larkinella rosea]